MGPITGDGDDNKKVAVVKKVSEEEALEIVDDILRSVAREGNVSLIGSIADNLCNGVFAAKAAVDFIEILLRMDKIKELTVFLDEMYDNDWPDGTKIEEATSKKMVKLLISYYISGKPVGEKFSKTMFSVLGALRDKVIDEIMADVPNGAQKVLLLKKLANSL